MTSSPTAEITLVHRRHHITRVVGVVGVGALLTCTGAWGVGHRAPRPMAPAAARTAANQWCAYNFPPSDASAAVDPNRNSYACNLGFIAGAGNPEAEAGRTESQLAVAMKQVGADHPQGMWGIAYQAAWRAGQDAARSA
jgi:hypothetical protein